MNTVRNVGFCQMIEKRILMKRQNVLWMNIINRTKIKIMTLFFVSTGISFPKK